MIGQISHMMHIHVQKDSATYLRSSITKGSQFPLPTAWKLKRIKITYVEVLDGAHYVNAICGTGPVPADEGSERHISSNDNCTIEGSEPRRCSLVME